MHGLGGSWRSWLSIIDTLASTRDVIAIDLPGFGETPPLRGETTVSLDPGGCWRALERHVFYASIALSIRLIRLLQPAMPLLCGDPFTRTLLFAQFSAHPSSLPKAPRFNAPCPTVPA